jgi:hypothetical protein
VVVIEGYAYLVPFVESENEIEIFLKTIIRAARRPNSTLVNPMSKLDPEEKEILEAFERV